MIPSAQEFVRLRTSEDMAEYHRAAHEEAPIDVWREVIRDYPDMRFWVAHNKTVPIEILEELSVDPDPRVRGMVADKRKTPPHLLERLARDAHESVRASVARHRKLPRRVLVTMLDDEWELVREIAAEKLHAAKEV